MMCVNVQFIANVSALSRFGSFASASLALVNFIQIALRIQVVPIFPLKLVQPREEIAKAGARNLGIFLSLSSLVISRLSLRVPDFAILCRGLTNSKRKIGLARGLTCT